MSAWTTDELARIGAAGEMDIATCRADGTLRKPRIIWVVRLDDDIDAANRAKYRGSPSAVSHITSEQARATSIELVPR
jgi:hypothetical protein